MEINENKGETKKTKQNQAAVQKICDTVALTTIMIIWLGSRRDQTL